MIRPSAAYVVVYEGPDEGRSVAGWYLAVAERGERGYSQLRPGFGPYRTREAAKAHATEMNTGLGLDERAAMEIALSSLRGTVAQ